MLHSRRHFCTAASTLAASCFLPAQQPTSRPDVAAIDHDRILAAANRYLSQPPAPLTSSRAPHAPGSLNEFLSNMEDLPPGTTPPPASEIFTGHQEALLQLTLAVPALTSAWFLTHSTDPARANAFAQQAARHLQAWFITPATRMEPSLNFAAVAPGTSGHPDGIVDTSALAEIAQSIPFLIRSEALSSEDIVSLKSWFADFLKWLTTSRLAALARDRKDHVGSSWMMQCAAYARLTADDTVLADLRHRFKTVTLRAEILSDGTFPHELTTPNPYRNSLFNLDLLAAACDLLSTRFETLWDYQLQDGPGLRVAIARLFPSIENRGAWPYRADAHLFNDLPCRRPALLFAARAFQRPEYATLWRSLNPDPTNPAILRSFPIRQPLLWVTRI